MKVIEFAFVGYPVTDLKRARDFYEHVLELTPASVWEDGGTGWIEYEVGPHTLAITNGDPENWKPSEQGAGVALEVENFDEAIGELRARQVQFIMEPFQSSMCRMALIADPDGNRIAIHKRNA